MKVSFPSPPGLGHKVQRIFHLSFPGTQTLTTVMRPRQKKATKTLTDLKTENPKRTGKSTCEVDI